MAAVMSLPRQQPAAAARGGPLQISTNGAKPSLRMPSPSMQLPIATSIRNGHLNLDVFSPVNQNGSFEFDRVLKSGEVYKRSRKTKQWKKFYLVLRPNLLSIYKNASEEKLHKQISLSDLTAVTSQKDPKGRRDHIFGLFSPSRNYHLQAQNEKEVRLWVDLIRQEARIDEEELDALYPSPVAQDKENARMSTEQGSGKLLEEIRELGARDRFVSSSPEPMDMGSRTSTRDGPRAPTIKPLSNDAEASGNDLAGSYSDFSDSMPVQMLAQRSSTSIPEHASRNRMHANSVTPVPESAATMKADLTKTTTAVGGIKLDTDEERVIMQGYLLSLNSKGGVRQWKKLWVVLRPKKLAFYKTNEEYAARLLIPLSNIISAVEIDPVSKAKSHCLQIIAEDKSYRFCAPSEDALARWLGALKSRLAKRKEGLLGRAVTNGL